MSVPLLVAATLAAALWPNEARLVLVSAAAVLVEALPFMLAGVLAERIAPRKTSIVAYAGCGCAGGPSARSLPAAALTWLTFGPIAAVTRVAAASIVARYARRNRDAACGQTARADLANELERLVPFAFAAAIGGQLAARLDLAHANLVLQIGAGIALGFAASPCALGAVAVAATLRAHAAASAAAFLCVAGIFDLNALHCAKTPERDGGDAFAYAALAIGAALVAYRHGAQLVRPGFAPLLAGCAVVAAILAVARRTQRARRLPIAPAVVLLGTLVAIPPPVYSATETTLAGIFPGERLSFTGVLVRNRRSTALVRYAITCCRADAAPVVVRLARPASVTAGSWAHAEGVVIATPGGLALSEDGVRPAPPPADPFLYR